MIINSRECPKPGEIWLHFKGHRCEILNYATCSETLDLLVIYKCDQSSENKSDNIWSRPLTMFMSEVDHDKYPEVTQKYRFEKMDVISE